MAEEKLTFVYKRDKPPLFCKIPLLSPFNFASNQINAKSDENKILLFYVKAVFEAVEEAWSTSFPPCNNEVFACHTPRI